MLKAKEYIKDQTCKNQYVNLEEDELIYNQLHYQTNVFHRWGVASLFTHHGLCYKNHNGFDVAAD